MCELYPLNYLTTEKSTVHFSSLVIFLMWLPLVWIVNAIQLTKYVSEAAIHWMPWYKSRASSSTIVITISQYSILYESASLIMKTHSHGYLFSVVKNAASILHLTKFVEGCTQYTGCTCFSVWAIGVVCCACCHAWRPP